MLAEVSQEPGVKSFILILYYFKFCDEPTISAAYHRLLISNVNELREKQKNQIQ